MAHELELKNGAASMFYVGDVPWHGLGTPLDRPATAKEAMAAAKLNWTVSKRELIAHPDIRVPNQYALVRDDTRNVLGIAGRTYTPLQNKDAFGFFDSIVGKKAAIYHTAGCLGQGERTWILAKLPGYIRVVKEDVSEKFLLLSNGHDGKTSVQVKFTPVRVVCQNTLTLALSQGATHQVWHSPIVHERLKEAGSLLGIVQDGFQKLEDRFRAFSRVRMTPRRLKGYLEAVFPVEETRTEEAKLGVLGNRQWAEFFFDQGRGSQLPGVRGTLWAALNSVTELVDHRKARKGEGRKLNSIWFGEGYRIKERALRIATDLLGHGRN